MGRVERRIPVAIENDGETIFGVLHLPEGKGLKPAVLLNHGFAGNKIGPKRIYVEQAEALSRAGIASLRIDFRGCGDSEGTFSDVTISRLVSDAVASLRFLAAHQEIDASRIGILGASLGGAVALLAANRFVQLKSMALWAPVAGGRLWQKEWKKFPKEVLDNQMKKQKKPTNRQFIRQFLMLSARRALKKLNHIPLLHVHGEQDDVVLPSHQEVYRKARVKAVLSEFVRLPHSDHSFSNDEAERLELLARTTEWFQQTLFNEESG